MPETQGRAECPTCRRPLPDSRDDVLGAARRCAIRASGSEVPSDLRRIWSTQRQADVSRRAVEHVEAMYYVGMTASEAEAIVADFFGREYDMLRRSYADVLNPGRPRYPGDDQEW